jgi:hypothetical protein
MKVHINTCINTVLHINFYDLLPSIIYIGSSWMWSYAKLDLQLPVQSVPITTKIVRSNPTQVRCTQYNIMWSSLSVTCGRFSPGTPVSSTNKTDHHNITEILLKVALNTAWIDQEMLTLRQTNYTSCSFTFMSVLSEWLLVNAKLAIFQLYHGKKNKLIFNEIMMRSVFHYTNTLSWIFIVLAHWNNSPQISNWIN